MSADGGLSLDCVPNDQAITAPALVAGAAGPRVVMLDARPQQLDEAGLRQAARDLCAASSAVHHSRSYSFPLAVAAVHTNRVGVDIERVASCDEAFAGSICTPEEMNRLPMELDRDTQLTSVWSGKEALSKALGDPLDYDPRRIGSPLFWREGRAGIWRAIALALPPGYVGWLCWQAPS